MTACAAALLLVTASGCVDNNPEEGWPDVRYPAPKVTSITYYGTGEVLSEAYMGDMVSINGTNLSDIIEVKFNDRKAQVNASLAMDTSIPVIIPADRPIRTTDKIYLTFRGGNVELDFHVICSVNPEARPMVMRAWREDMSRPVTKAYGGERVVLTGFNLKNVAKVTCGLAECGNLSYSASEAEERLAFDLPVESESDILLLATDTGKAYPYNFKVSSVAPALPRVWEMSCEWAPVGSLVTLRGVDFAKGMEVAFGEVSVPGEAIEVVDASTARFSMPAGVRDGTRLICVAPDGSDYTASEIFYRDTRGMMFDFEPLKITPIPFLGKTLRTESGGNGWSPGASGGNTNVTAGAPTKPTKIGYDPTFALTSPDPGYLQLGNDPERGVEWVARPSHLQFSQDEGLYNLFTYWGVAEGETPYNNQVSTALDRLPSVAPILRENDLGHLGLKFELRVPQEKGWSAQSLQIIFTSLSTVRNVQGAQTLSYLKSAGQPRAVFCPWHDEPDGVFDTEGQWVTVMIPLSEFNLTISGEQCERSLSKEDIAGLTLFLGGGPHDGNECRPLLQIDNIRLAKIIPHENR